MSLCNCSRMARLPELTDGVLTKHHPYCAAFEGKKKFIQIKLDGGGIYTVEPNEFHGAFCGGELDGLEVGTKWTIEIVEMYQEQYDALPEFMGH